jgi:hypothetical protein
MTTPTTHRISSKTSGENRGPVRALQPLKKEMKYVTGRFDKAGVEKLVLLRARLNLDNSALLNRAVSELYETEQSTGISTKEGATQEGSKTES